MANDYQLNLTGEQVEAKLNKIDEILTDLSQIEQTYATIASVNKLQEDLKEDLENIEDVKVTVAIKAFQDKNNNDIAETYATKEYVDTQIQNFITEILNTPIEGDVENE